ncbi:hypothetical protein [Synechococcus sp. BIOS-E4-1]|uniref:hypothetical protein n=1 Tax=Synechococcus sp. BIOS-E4-1 TaxID=1400864 RepID=UPI0016490A8F|nr:hypothetical protein [Synechococcus sp. BIOS-E4-1]
MTYRLIGIAILVLAISKVIATRILIPSLYIAFKLIERTFAPDESTQPALALITPITAAIPEADVPSVPASTVKPKAAATSSPKKDVLVADVTKDAVKAPRKARRRKPSQKTLERIQSLKVST